MKYGNKKEAEREGERETERKIESTAKPISYELVGRPGVTNGRFASKLGLGDNGCSICVQEIACCHRMDIYDCGS